MTDNNEPQSIAREIASLRDAILRSNVIPESARLWDRAQVAEYFGVCRSQSLQITGKPGFPAPTHVAGRQSPRWFAAEVVLFAKRSR